MAASNPSRLAYIDWMRGLACVLMFQTHCYDSWLSPGARQSKFFMYSQLGGTFPAPLFLFLAGISFALVTEKLWKKNLPPAQIARATIRRGAEIFGFGLLFRLQEYLIAWGWAPLSDLLRVDMLNTIGLSMMLMGVVCWLALSFHRGAPMRDSRLVTGLCWNRCVDFSAHAAAVDHLAPELAALAAGVLHQRRAQSRHTAGLAVSRFFPGLLSPSPGSPPDLFCKANGHASVKPLIFFLAGAAGLVFVAAARWLDAQPHQLYAIYDYWHTSPNFFLIRVGMLLAILTASYAWCRWGAGQWGFSPLIQLGQASLLVYWVHLEFVYGRFSILPKHSAEHPNRILGIADDLPRDASARVPADAAEGPRR